MSCAKTAEPIQTPLRVLTLVDPTKHVFDGGAHWCNVANTIESFMCGGDAAFLSSYLDYRYLFVVNEEGEKGQMCRDGVTEGTGVYVGHIPRVGLIVRGVVIVSSFL